MHAHEFHKPERAHQNHVAANLRAEPAAFVAPEGIDAVVPAVLVVHDFLKQRHKTAARRLHHGVCKADDLADRAVGVDLHAVERDVLRREQVRVFNRNAALAAEHSCPVPAADRRARARKPPCLRGKRAREAQKHARREACNHQRRPCPEEAIFRLQHAQNGKPQRHCRQNRRVDAHHPTARIGNFQLTDKFLRLCVASENAVLAMPRLFLPDRRLRLVHRAGSLERAQLRQLHRILSQQRCTPLQRHRRAERNAPGADGNHRVHRAGNRQHQQHARVVIAKPARRAHAAQRHIPGDKRLHNHYNKENARKTLCVRRKIVASDRIACRVAEPDRHERQQDTHKQPQPLECSLRVVGICRAAVGKLALGLLFAALGALCLLLLMTLQLPAPLLRLFLRALRAPCRLLRLFGIARRRGLRVRLCLIGPDLRLFRLLRLFLPDRRKADGLPGEVRRIFGRLFLFFFREALCLRREPDNFCVRCIRFFCRRPLLRLLLQRSLRCFDRRRLGL